MKTSFKVGSCIAIGTLNLLVGFILGAYFWFGGHQTIKAYVPYLLLIASLIGIYLILSKNRLKNVVIIFITALILLLQQLGIVIGQVDYFIAKPWTELDSKDWPEIKNTFYLAINNQL
ncbi:hypothetical protein [Chitinibacter sp. GC72]|uniref:hypothetical protein n=1 Tax=Chitinibacter sp. GC72 TaxID=1526917 RepID=UPI0012F94F43|nr:hypothetical protein [Chitinibacter sp. GC72]